MGRILTFILLFVTLWMIFTTVNLPKSGETEEISRQTLELINQERKEQGIAPLIWDNTLERLAIAHSQYMADTDILEHSDYNYTENIAQGGTSDAVELYNLWRNSLLHHANYMDRSLRYGAIGIAYKLTNVTLGSINITVNISRGYATFIAK